MRLAAIFGETKAEFIGRIIELVVLMTRLWRYLY